MKTFLFLILAAAQGHAFEAAFYPGSHTTLSVLENGLSVIITEDPSYKTGSVRVYVKGGGADELPGKTGIAHLFEHMMFSFPEFNALNNRWASVVNAFTCTHATVYTNDLMPEALEEHLKIEGERFQAMQVDPKLLEIEKGAVHSEYQMDLTTVQAMAMRMSLQRKAFPESPFAGWAMGALEDLKGLSADDCMEFYRRIYAPENCAVIVVGPWKAEQAQAWVKQYFGAWKGGGKAAPYREPAGFRAGYLGLAEYPAPYPHMLAGFRLMGPSLKPGSLDDFILHLFFYSPWAKLKQSLRHQRSLISYSGPFYAAEDSALVCVEMAVNPGVKPEKVVQALQSLPEMIDSMSEPDLADFKREWRFGYRGGCLHPVELSARLGQAWASGGLDEFSAFMRETPAFKRGAVAARAKEFFAAGNIAAVAAGLP